MSDYYPKDQVPLRHDSHQIPANDSYALLNLNSFLSTKCSKTIWVIFIFNCNPLFNEKICTALQDLISHKVMLQHTCHRQWKQKEVKQQNQPISMTCSIQHRVTSTYCITSHDLRSTVPQRVCPLPPTMKDIYFLHLLFYPSPCFFFFFTNWTQCSMVH